MSGTAYVCWNILSFGCSSLGCSRISDNTMHFSWPQDQIWRRQALCDCPPWPQRWPHGYGQIWGEQMMTFQSEGAKQTQRLASHDCCFTSRPVICLAMHNADPCGGIDIVNPFPWNSSFEGVHSPGDQGCWTPRQGGWVQTSLHAPCLVHA